MEKIRMEDLLEMALSHPSPFIPGASGGEDRLEMALSDPSPFIPGASGGTRTDRDSSSWPPPLILVDPAQAFPTLSVSHSPSSRAPISIPGETDRRLIEEQNRRDKLALIYNAMKTITLKHKFSWLWRPLAFPIFGAAAASARGSGSPRWFRKFKLGGSSSSSLLPVVVAPTQRRQPVHSVSHSPGTREFTVEAGAGAARPRSQSAAAEGTSILVSEVLQGGSGGGGGGGRRGSASSSPSHDHDTTTRTPSPTGGENTAADATCNERRSGSPPGPTDPPATVTSPGATTTVNDDAVNIAIFGATLAIFLSVDMKGTTNSWEIQWQVLYLFFLLFSALITVIGIFGVVAPAGSRARKFSAWCSKLGLLAAIFLFFVSRICLLGPFGCIIGAPIAAVLVIFLALVWWKYYC